MESGARRNKCVIITILIWTALIRLFDPALLFSIQYWSHNKKETYDIILNLVAILFYLFLPIFSLLTDIKFGWLKTATISACVGALCTLVYIVLLVAGSKVGDDLILVLDPLVLFTRIYFQISVLCLGIYQLIEMSSNSDQLSSFIWWYVWCYNLGMMTTQVTTCLLKNHEHYDIYLISIHFFLLLIITISALVIKKWAVRNHYAINPLKLISGVLYFALKNKYPLNRSALTYWEEVKPSRINLGKAKYGGPFLEKDVESVKTYFCLLSLVAVVTMTAFPYLNLGRIETEKVSLIQCFVYRTYFIYYGLNIIFIPLYLYIIKPYCFPQVRISMLKRIGIGIALVVLSKLGYVALDLYITVPVYVDYNETVCLLHSTLNDTVTTDFMSSTYTNSLTVIKVISAFGFLFAVPGCLEFVLAQAPHSMRGLLIGSWFCLFRFYQIAGWMMIKPFKAVSEYLAPSCELYVLIMNSLVVVFSFVVFLLLGRRYKLHSNEDVLNVHLIAEIHYENEFNRRDRYGSI